MLYPILYPFIIGLINAFRGAGNGWFTRPAAAIYMGIATEILAAWLGYPSHYCVAILLIVTIGFFTGAVMGWGAGFAAFHGRKDPMPEILVIDKIADFIVRNPYTISEIRNWGVVWMTLRGGLFYPMFYFLSHVTGGSALWGLSCLSMGVVYGVMRYIPEKNAVRTAELTFATIYGATILLTLTIN